MKNDSIKSGFLKIIWILKETEINKKALIWGFILATILIILNFFLLSLMFPIVNLILYKDLTVINNLNYLTKFIDFFNIEGSYWKILIFLGAFLYATTILKTGIKYLTFVCINLQSQTASMKIREIIFKRYLSFGKLFFDNKSTGELNGLLLESSNAINRSLDGVNRIIIETITILVYLIFLIGISWKLTLLSLPLLGLLYYFSNRIKLKIKDLSQERDNVQKRFLNKISEIISCIVLVKGFGKEEQEENNFKNESDNEIDSNVKIQKKLQLIPQIEEFLTTTTILIIAGSIALVSIYDPSMAAANAIVFIYLLMRIPGSISTIQSTQTSLVQIQGKLKDVENILDDQDKYIFSGGDKIFDGLKEKISIKNLNFGYTEKQVLEGLSFDIKRGEKVAIIGKTGSGKSTLANILLRFYDCPEGTIFIDDIDIRDYDLKSIKKHFAFVTQNAILFNDTIRSNILYANETVAQERFEDVISKLNLKEITSKFPEDIDYVVGEKGSKLSGGEKQRISLARALIKDASFIILDEPTSSLDVKTEKEITEATRGILKDKTVLIIAHRISTILNSDRIIIIENGKIIEQGTVEELKSLKSEFSKYLEASQ